MKDGAVIMDMAVTAGGNYKGSKADEVVDAHGVKVISYSKLPGRVAADASPLYARNLYQFVADLMVDKEAGALSVKWDDELIQGTLICKDGEIVHPLVREIRGLPKLVEAEIVEDTPDENDAEKEEQAAS